MTRLKTTITGVVSRAVETFHSLYSKIFTFVVIYMWVNKENAVEY